MINIIILIYTPYYKTRKIKIHRGVLLRISWSKSQISPVGQYLRLTERFIYWWFSEALRTPCAGSAPHSEPQTIAKSVVKSPSI